MRQCSECPNLLARSILIHCKTNKILIKALSQNIHKMNKKNFQEA